jgi:hypothetical protein
MLISVILAFMTWLLLRHNSVIDEPPCLVIRLHLDVTYSTENIGKSINVGFFSP